MTRGNKNLGGIVKPVFRETFILTDSVGDLPDRLNRLKNCIYILCRSTRRKSQDHYRAAKKA